MRPDPFWSGATRAAALALLAAFVAGIVWAAHERGYRVGFYDGAQAGDRHAAVLLCLRHDDCDDFNKMREEADDAE